MWTHDKDYTTLNKRHSILINSKPLLQCMNDKEIQLSQTSHASAGYSTEEDNYLVLTTVFFIRSISTVGNTVTRLSIDDTHLPISAVKKAFSAVNVF